MTKELTLKDLQTKKEQLQNDIGRLIITFEDETALRPNVTTYYRKYHNMPVPGEIGRYKIVGGELVVEIEVKL